jgi:hypothetical protein
LPPPAVVASLARCAQNARAADPLFVAAASKLVAVLLVAVPVAVGFWTMACSAVPVRSTSPVISNSRIAHPVWLTAPNEAVVCAFDGVAPAFATHTDIVCVVPRSRALSVSCEYETPWPLTDVGSIGVAPNELITHATRSELAPGV